MAPCTSGGHGHRRATAIRCIGNMIDAANSYNCMSSIDTISVKITEQKKARKKHQKSIGSPPNNH